MNHAEERPHRHTASPADLEFRRRFEAGLVPPADFDHRAHVRLAFTCLTQMDVDAAHDAVRTAISRFLEKNAIDPAKYHDTLTRAWLMAVRHFMDRTPPVASADAFIDASPALLDSKIMLSHYSKERLFSPEARAGFVEPDLEPIPPAARGARAAGRGAATEPDTGQ